MNNLRDYETDKRAGKKSLPVRFGMEFGKWEFASSVFLGPLIPLILFATTGKHPWSLSSCLSFGIGLPIIEAVFHDPSPKNLAPLFPKVGKLLTIYTVLFVIGWLV
jgi:1,4-dihydroxy-2-naphthoate octaprenyltransferase